MVESTLNCVQYKMDIRPIHEVPKRPCSRIDVRFGTETRSVLGGTGTLVQLVSNLCNPSDAVRTMNKPDQRCPNWSALNRSKELLNSSFIKFCSVRIGIQNIKNLCFRSVLTELRKQNVQPGPNRIRFPLNRTELFRSPWNRTETVRSDHTGPVVEPNRDSSVRSYRSGS